MLRRQAVSLLGAAVLTVPCAASADPQANAAVTAGIAGAGTEAEWWRETRGHLGARGDVLFGRASNNDFGWGPFAEIMTAFDDLQLGGGASALLPVHSYLPIVASAGGYGRHTGGFGWEPGVSGQLFWGSRSYNYSSVYVMAGGLSVQARWGLGDARERMIIVAAHLDGEVLALPFLLLAEALRGPRAE